MALRILGKARDIRCRLDKSFPSQARACYSHCWLGFSSGSAS